MSMLTVQKSLGKLGHKNSEKCVNSQRPASLKANLFAIGIVRKAAERSSFVPTPFGYFGCLNILLFDPKSCDFCSCYKKKFTLGRDSNLDSKHG